MVAGCYPGAFRAILIIPYFGKFGPWFPLFLKSLSRQSTIDLLLITDTPTPELPANARCLEMSLGAMRALAEAKLGTPVRLERPYKLCDLKPAYGLIFEDHIHGYDYWAFGDEDVLYGDLDRLLAPRLTSWPDMVVPNHKMTVGHLTLLRTCERIKRLVLAEPRYRAVLAAEANHSYDEEGGRHATLHDPSFTRTVKTAEARGEITVNWGLPIRGDVPRRGHAIRYDGRGIVQSDGRELAYYHWGRLRRRGWKFPTPDEADRGFIVDSVGFRAAELPAHRRLAREAHSLAMGALHRGGGQLHRLWTVPVSEVGQRGVVLRSGWAAAQRE